MAKKKPSTPSTNDKRRKGTHSYSKTVKVEVPFGKSTTTLGFDGKRHSRNAPKGGTAHSKEVRTELKRKRIK